MPKYKKTDYKSDKMQKDKIKLLQNTKQHITNIT